MRDYHIHRIENRVKAFKRKGQGPSRITGFMKISKILVVLLVPIFLGVAAWKGYQRLLAHPYFQIKEVKVEGNERLSQEDIVKDLRLPPRASLLTIDLAGIGRNLRENPWIKVASLRRQLPSTLVVKVKERTPLAIFMAARPYLIGEEGVVLRELEWEELPDLPRLRVVASYVLSPGERISTPDFSKAVELWQRLTVNSPLQGMKLKEIALEGEGSFALNFGPGTPRLKLRSNGFDEQLERLAQTMALAGQSPEAYEYVDLRFQERVVLKPIKGEVRRVGQRR